MYKTTPNKVINLISKFNDVFKLSNFEILYSHDDSSNLKFKCNYDFKFDIITFLNKLNEYKYKFKNISDKFIKIFLYDKEEENDNKFFCYICIHENECYIIFYEKEVI